MVRIFRGRHPWELYYTRTPVVLRKEEMRRRLSLVAAHLGYLTGVGEYLMTDMLLLRIFALTGCGLIVAYQSAQPRIQWISAGWNTLFAFTNIFHILPRVFLLVRPDPVFLEEEEALLADLQGQLDDQLTRRQFASLLAVGEWRALRGGEVLLEEGLSHEGHSVFLVSSGTCRVLQGGRQLRTLGRGRLVGELEVPPLAAGGAAAPLPAIATVVAEGDARCLALPWARLRASPEALDALQGVLAASLVSKAVSAGCEAGALQYGAVLETAHRAGLDPDDEAVAGFRRRYMITDQQHERAVAELSHCSDGGRWPN
ncbi:unnamed protein product [Prorocentrum cordatum]|uniref:Cyclic nucleotide-binding domain-containing protein n=1 Tax=Prorocentrum cordatum TaxID=2364126 RepID=A0ABN9QP46_9DINO|nr:unnamed protein product [Polarella glacialis]